MQRPAVGVWSGPTYRKYQRDAASIAGLKPLAEVAARSRCHSVVTNHTIHGGAVPHSNGAVRRAFRGPLRH